jgi:hypothetical protein
MACNEKEVLRERLYDNKALKMFFQKEKSMPKDRGRPY